MRAGVRDSPSLHDGGLHFERSAARAAFGALRLATLVVVRNSQYDKNVRRCHGRVNPAEMTCPVTLASTNGFSPEAEMEIWGLGLGAALALWRYFFDVDWDLRLKRRRRRKTQG